MKKSTVIWIVIGVVALAAIPFVVMAAKPKDKDKDKTPEKKKGKKSSVTAGPTEKQTEEEFEKDRQKLNQSLGPLGGIGAAVTAFLATLPTYEVVTSSGDLNIREKPNTTSAIIGTLKKGEKVKGSVPKDGWIQVAKGKQGYVSARFMKKVAEGTAAVK